VVACSHVLIQRYSKDPVLARRVRAVATTPRGAHAKDAIPMAVAYPCHAPDAPSLSINANHRSRDWGADEG